MTDPILKNIAEGKLKALFESGNIRLMLADNRGPDEYTTPGMLSKKLIQFYFCLEGTARFEFGPMYSREIQRLKNYFFYNPDSDVPFKLQLSADARMVMLFISLENLHELFTHEPLPFLKGENINRKFYDERDIPASLLVVLNQLFTIQLSESARNLFYHGKVFEILSLYFSEKKPDTETCPFLNDEETVRKIKHAKEYLLKNMETPPGLKALAKYAGLNEYQLKAGFKQIYGNTVFGYLLDHKMDHARILLDSGKFKVNEVAYQMGYTNPSHFIAAFRKKFGVTPKKYLMQLGV
ncbi:MAG: AraC family transcriptional regulator [Cyclobacteriaceae bacterium]|jgi:AraC-like DNA-binding protein|nr:AraC family transcriptional regulator [Cyclobacteriaceae bacterium]